MRRNRGFSLTEVLVVLVIVGILAAIAAPSLRAVIRRERVRGALNRVAGDLHYARMLAVRSGQRTVVRFAPAPECAGSGRTPIGSRRWTVEVRGPGVRVARRASLDDAGGRYPFCLEMNGSDTVAFDSRGLLVPFGNRTMRVVDGEVRDSLSISALGRILPRY